MTHWKTSSSSKAGRRQSILQLRKLKKSRRSLCRRANRSAPRVTQVLSQSHKLNLIDARCAIAGALAFRNTIATATKERAAATFLSKKAVGTTRTIKAG